MTKQKEQHFRIGLFITARTDSSRLPGKMLADIRGKPVIEHDIDRTKLVRGIDAIVLCTSDRKQDDILADIAVQKDINCFRGSLEDKLARWLGAAEKFKLDYFITFDGDDLFCEPELIELAVAQIKKERPDFLRSPKNLICGAFTFGIATTALRKVCKIKDTSNTEMQWVYFTDTGLFKVSELKITDHSFLNKKIRMTLDYQEDLNFFRHIFDELDTDMNNIPLRQIITLIRTKPEIARINFFRQQDFLDNEKKKTVLKIKDRYIKK